jgi:hypothetical protein
MTDNVEQLGRALAPRYAIQGRYAQSTATVFKATDVRHGRVVAIKAVHADTDDAGAQRIANELAWMTGVTHHPFIVPVLDGGSTAGWNWFVMPFLSESSLEMRLRAGPLDIAEALRFTREIADALQHAHSLDVIHRDVKPANILVAGGHAVLTDFGIAWWSKPTGRQIPLAAPSGTLPYMSLSVLSREPATPSSDVFALAATCYELLTGCLAFPQENWLRQLNARAAEPPVPASELRPDVPQALTELLDLALAPGHEKHFATAIDFGAEIAQIARGNRSIAAAYRSGRPAPVFVHGALGLGARAEMREVLDVVVSSCRAALLDAPSIMIASTDRDALAWDVAMKLLTFGDGPALTVEITDVRRGMLRWATRDAIRISVGSHDDLRAAADALASSIRRVIAPETVSDDDYEVVGFSADDAAPFVDVLEHDGEQEAMRAIAALHAIMDRSELDDQRVRVEDPIIDEAWTAAQRNVSGMAGALRTLRARWTLLVLRDPAGAIREAGAEPSARAVLALSEAALGHLSLAAAVVAEGLVGDPVEAWQFRALAQAARCARVPHLVRETASQAAAAGIQDPLCLALAIEVADTQMRVHTEGNPFEPVAISVEGTVTQHPRLALALQMATKNPASAISAERGFAVTSDAAAIALANGDPARALKTLRIAAELGAPSTIWMRSDPRWDAVWTR